MKTPRLYLDEPDLQPGQQVTLPKDAAKYLIRVLRRSTGDAVTLFNGDGYNYAAEIIEADSKAAVLISEKHRNDTESPFDITLVQSLAKGTKLDLVIQKATELGVKKIVPVIADRSIMQVDSARLKNKMSHWRGVAISASTQCGRSTVPEINSPAELQTCFSLAAGQGLLLHPDGRHSVSDIKLEKTQCTVFIGPEGGFTNDELASATSAGINIVTCGPRILRTETAGFTAISVLQSRYGDL